MTARDLEAHARGEVRLHKWIDGSMIRHALSIEKFRGSAFDDKLQELLDAIFGVSPSGWLPSFQPTTPDWYVGAYLRAIPALAGVAVLAWLGLRTKARS